MPSIKHRSTRKNCGPRRYIAAICACTITMLTCGSVGGLAQNADPAIKTIDLAQYCKDKHGDTAIVSLRIGDHKPLCTVRAKQGIGQLHYPVDAESLCSAGTVPRVKDDGRMLACLPGAGGANRPGAGTGGQAEKGSSAMPGGHDNAVAAGDGGSQQGGNGTAPVRTRDLVGQWEMKAPWPGVEMELSEKGGKIVGRVVHVPPALAGPFKVFYLGDTKIEADNVYLTAQVSPAGIEAQTRFAVMALDSHAPYTCRSLYRNKGNWPSFTFKLDEDTLSGKQKLRQIGRGCKFEGKVVGPRDTIDVVLVSKSRIVEVYFTTAEAPFERIKSVPLDRPFTVTVLFSSRPKQDRQTVRVEQDGLSHELIAKKTEQPKLFRTDPIVLKEGVLP